MAGSWERKVCWDPGTGQGELVSTSSFTPRVLVYRLLVVRLRQVVPLRARVFLHGPRARGPPDTQSLLDA